MVGPSRVLFRPGRDFSFARRLAPAINGWSIFKRTHGLGRPVPATRPPLRSQEFLRSCFDKDAAPERGWHRTRIVNREPCERPGRGPGGTSENSPAFQRRDHGANPASPAGTAEFVRVGSAVPAGLIHRPAAPGVETPGYAQCLLRSRDDTERIGNREPRERGKGRARRSARAAKPARTGRKPFAVRPPAPDDLAPTRQLANDFDAKDWKWQPSGFRFFSSDELNRAPWKKPVW